MFMVTQSKLVGQLTTQRTVIRGYIEAHSPFDTELPCVFILSSNTDTDLMQLLLTTQRIYAVMPHQCSHDAAPANNLLNICGYVTPTQHV